MTEQKKQVDRFRDAAKEAGAEMSDAEFKKVVGKLAKAPKPKRKTPKTSDQPD